MDLNLITVITQAPTVPGRPVAYDDGLLSARQPMIKSFNPEPENPKHQNPKPLIIFRKWASQVGCRSALTQ